VKNIDESLPLDIRGCVGVLRLAAEETNNLKESKVLISAKELHPTNLNCLDKEIVRNVREKYEEHIDRLSRKYNVESEEILRIAFAVRCNKYSSGLFLHASIFNHSCRPNCIKFQPSKSNSKSEIWTTRHVEKGEPFTISYLHPAEQHGKLRRKRLSHQFLFECACDRCCEEKKEKNDEDVDHDVIESLEQSIEEIENVNDVSNERRLDYVIAVLKDLESKKKKHNVEDTISLLARSLKTRIEMRASKLQKSSSSTSLHDTAREFLLDCLDLEKIQIRLGMKDHPDFGRTKCDIASALEALLDNEKDKIPPGGFSSRREARISMRESRLEYIRIRDLYSVD
jgi:hypothetical protein